MTGPKVTGELWHKLLTIAITIMIIITGYMATSVHSNNKATVALSEAFILMGADVANHNINAAKYIEQIEDNTKRIIALETMETLATSDRFTGKDAQKLIEEMKEFIDERYQRK